LLDRSRSRRDGRGLLKGNVWGRGGSTAVRFRRSHRKRLSSSDMGRCSGHFRRSAHTERRDVWAHRSHLRYGILGSDRILSRQADLGQKLHPHVLLVYQKTKRLPGAIHGGQAFVCDVRKVGSVHHGVVAGEGIVVVPREVEEGLDPCGGSLVSTEPLLDVLHEALGEGFVPIRVLSFDRVHVLPEHVLIPCFRSGEALLVVGRLHLSLRFFVQRSKANVSKVEEDVEEALSRFVSEHSCCEQGRVHREGYVRCLFWRAKK